jgi:hypothetical protein
MTVNNTVAVATLWALGAMIKMFAWYKPMSRPDGSTDTVRSVGVVPVVGETVIHPPDGVVSTRILKSVLIPKTERV